MTARQDGDITPTSTDGPLEQFDKAAYAIEGDIIKWLLEQNRVITTSKHEQQAHILSCLQKAESGGISMVDLAGYLLRRLALHRMGWEGSEAVASVMSGRDRAHAQGVQSYRRKQSIRASQKGKIWRRAAIEQWNEKHDQFESLPEFCQSIAGKLLFIDEYDANDERLEGRAPRYRQTYDVMREARKNGELKVKVKKPKS